MQLSAPSEPRPARSLTDLSADVELIVVSNRGPIECHLDENDGINHVRGAGGVAAALSFIAAFTPISWVFSALTEADRRLAKTYDSLTAAQLKRMGIREALRPYFVVLPRPVFHKYYEEFSNRVLWFLQHYMWNSPYEPRIDQATYDAWNDGYKVANELFAEKVAEIAARATKMPVILLQDYHLYLTPAMLRRKLPSSVITHFTHIPWPEPRYWAMLPCHIRDAIFRSLIAADILGFQTKQDARNFLDGCLTFIRDARIDRKSTSIALNDHLARVRVFPISVDPEQLRRRASSARVQRYLDCLRPLCGEKTIVRVDRVEPSKNIVRGLDAFAALLTDFPEYVGRVKMLMFLVPSRDRLPEYRRYRSEVMKRIAAINEHYRIDGWQPIEIFYENNYDQALAGLSLYDVLVVSPLIDGMNLVAKEGPIVNARDGVLVLSEGAGAFHQLKEGAVPIAPGDVEGIKCALRTALEMPPLERRVRADRLRRAIEREDIRRWFEAQLLEISDLLEQRRPSAQQID